MCLSNSNTSLDHRPAHRISGIILREAGVSIDPAIVRLIIKYNWRELAKAAHEIHDGH